MASFARRALLAALALFASACLSPTLPLPPPEQPEVIGPDADGLTELRGEVTSGAWIYAFNRNTGDGQFQDTGDTGQYRIVITTEVGDRMALWYTLGGEKSDSLYFEIRDPND